MGSGYVIGNEDLLNKISVNQINNKGWTLVYIKGGNGMYLLDDTLRCLNEGDLILLPPRVDFSFAADDLGDEYNVNIAAVVFQFDHPWLSGVLSTFPVCSEAILCIMEQRTPVSVSGPKWMKLSALMAEAVFSHGARQAVIVMQVLELLSTGEDYTQIKEVIECDAQNIAEKIVKTNRYLECNFCEKISLEDVSRYVGMSRIYFCQFFKMHYKEGFSDYLTRLRVEKASVMLLQTEKSLPSIASECGFKTVQYFTRAFKRVKGVTPGALRRSAR